jgi:hypothetical protein
MKRKAVSTFRKESLWKSHETQPGSQKNYKTRVKASSRASISLKSISPHQTYLSLHQMNTKTIFENKGSLPSKRATRTNPTMSIFETKIALTYYPPTHRLTSRPHGIVSTGSQPLISWSIKRTLSSPDDTMISEVYTDTVACIYNVDGKCKGMLTPECLNILRKAFDRAKFSGLHNHVQPPPISFASELVGLIARKDTSASKHTNKKSKTLSHGYSPPTSPPPFKSGGH